MAKIFTLALVATIALGFASSAYAAGGQWHGEGELVDGPTYQLGECPAFD